MILEPPMSVQKLQMALQAKAKEVPGYRFYLLYDKLYRKDVLEYAYRCCKANKGAPGVDEQEFADITAYGEERWLGELADTLRRKTYRAEAVRRVWIPKAGNKSKQQLMDEIAEWMKEASVTQAVEAEVSVRVNAGVAYRNVLQLHNGARWVAHTHEVLDALDSLLFDTVGTQTAA